MKKINFDATQIIKTKIFYGRTSVPIIFRRLIGLTEDNEKDYEVLWSVSDSGRKLEVSIEKSNSEVINNGK